MDNQDALFFEGNLTEVHLPSGRVVSIRETNGADDELLSNIADVKDSSNTTKFLTSIITQDFTLGRKPQASEVLQYHLNDRWYLMFKQRVINRGPELIFNHVCSEEACRKRKPQEFTEDLAPLDADLSKKDYEPQGLQIWKYPLGLELRHQFQLSSGETLVYDIMTGVHEKKLLDIPNLQQNKNTMLQVRNLSLVKGSETIPITSFGQLSSKKMSEVRAQVNKHDRDWNPVIEGNCGYCGRPFAITLFSMPDFFWPGETI